MARNIRFTTLALSTLALIATTFVGSAPVLADPSSPDEPDRMLTSGLAELAEAFGDSSGHIVMRNDAGEPLLLAIGQRSLEVYTAGDAAYLNDTFALCSQDERGELASCSELDLAADDDDGGTQFECHPDPDSGNYCECTGFYDCVHMFRLAVCNETPTCDESGCACTSN